MNPQKTEHQNRMQLFLERYNFYLSKVENILLVLASILLTIALLAVSTGVIGRYFFDKNLTWSIELNEYIMLYIAFLVASWILKDDDHVQVDIITSKLSDERKRKLNLITSILGIIVCLVIFWYSFEVTLDNYQRGVVISNVMEIPKYIPLVSIPIGSLMLFLRYLHKIGTIAINKVDSV